MLLFTSNWGGGGNLIQKGFLSYQTLFDEIMLALNAGSKNCPSYTLHNCGQEKNRYFQLLLNTCILLIYGIVER